jgi:hypothetical protein
MELDVGQIDLLDLPLPPEPKEAATDDPEPRVSKGPPPLPASLPSISAAPPPPALPAVISARTLLNEPPKERSSVTRFLLGMGAATALCVIAFFVFRTLHKTPPLPQAALTNTNASATPAPTHAFTMAPVEFTGPVSSETEPESSAAASSAAPPVRAGSGHPAPPTTQTGAVGKPPHPDDVIKVEN